MKMLKLLTGAQMRARMRDLRQWEEMRSIFRFGTLNPSGINRDLGVL